MKKLGVIVFLFVIIFSSKTISAKIKIKSSSLNSFVQTQPIITKKSENKETKTSFLATSMRVLSNLKKIVIGNKAEIKTENIEPGIIGKALVYPNPFRIDDGAHLGYELTKDLDIEIHIYDIFAHKVLQKFISSGDDGGMSGWNKFPINYETLDNYKLSSGVYLFIIMHNGKVLGKGKMAVVP
jgi:hypothetical protein